MLLDLASEDWRAVVNVNLHGTFLVDANGKIRWMDTGALPFTKADFVLAEAQRLLKLGTERPLPG